MTEIADAEAAEVLWASSEQGKAAVREAYRKAGQLGLDLTMADVSAIVCAAHWGMTLEEFREGFRRHHG